ncbi:uncharacterized protein LOC135694147 [Rhopilema esculentum]|uniref:uncharacterized protein LOC135694147 n=1 Tax=Rhopilema esculentum TaxID=499914 RepID=UPI0031D2D237
MENNLHQTTPRILPWRVDQSIVKDILIQLHHTELPHHDDVFRMKGQIAREFEIPRATRFRLVTPAGHPVRQIRPGDEIHIRIITGKRRKKKENKTVNLKFNL